MGAGARSSLARPHFRERVGGMTISRDGGTRAGGAYAGDVDPQTAFDALAASDDAALVDVRTAAEWSFVGVADLSASGKDAIMAEWQGFPTMARNPSFEDQVAAALKARGLGGSSRIYFLCRSGARSRAAAIAMTARGFSHCFNITHGFEGDHDADGHRGRMNGWKASGLPWRQG